MNSYLSYLLAVNTGMLLLGGLYGLLLKNETDHRSKRWYLLLAMVSSLSFPLLNFSLPGPVQSVPTLPESIPVAWLPTLAVGDAVAPEASPVNYLQSVQWGLLAGTVVITLVFLAQLLSLLRLIRRAKPHAAYRLLVAETNLPLTAFSFFRFVVIGGVCQSEADRALMLRHEAEHARRWHTVDLLIAQLLVVICWFNPVAWWLRRTVKHLHEFEADAAVASDYPGEEYPALLARVALHQAGFVVASHFNHGTILHRIKQLHTMKTQIQSWKWVTTASAVALFFFVSACHQQKDYTSTLGDQTLVIKDMPADILKKVEALKEQNPGKQVIAVENDSTSKSTLERIDASTVSSMYVEKDEASGRSFSILIGGNLKMTGSTAEAEEVFTIVEQAAQPNPDLTTFMTWLAGEMKYPTAAKEKGVSGTVFIEFLVQEDGSLSDFKVVRGIGSGCEEEALRVLKLSPAWKPAQQRGRAVVQKMVLPVSFNLQGNTGEQSSVQMAKDHFTVAAVQSQINGNTVIEGVVKDGNGEPVEDVNIVLEASTEGTHTLHNGQFKFTSRAPEGTLVFSHISYATVKVPFSKGHTGKLQ
ncbi:MAG: TonB family protein [Cyclobacteriaceae bacterium]|nr:TonB family protein [Cyclobacteriaceae bacterium]